MFIIIITLKLLFKWPTCEIHWINISLTSMSAQLNGKHWLFCTFLKFNPFFFIFMANFPFERCWSVHILKSRFKKAYVLYTHLNADNYEWPLPDEIYHIIISVRDDIWREKYCLIFAILQFHIISLWQLQ